MLLSLALILLFGISLSLLCQKIKLPGLIGMLFTGILLGPYVLNLIDSSILDISADIRKIALIIILTRAGLGLDVKGLKEIGRPALLMCFLPASFELMGMLILGKTLLGLTLLDSAILGSVLAAVSPAVVVPRMVRLTEEGYGMDKKIPQLILAGASVDDVYVIVLFTTFTAMATGGSISVASFINIPLSIVLGIAVGIMAGIILAFIFSLFHLRDTLKVLIILSISFLLAAGETALVNLELPFTFSALISIMFIGISLKGRKPEVASRLSIKFSKLWVGAEIFLFVLVGACVNIDYLRNVGPAAIFAIMLALVFRMLGVFVCIIGTKLNVGERIFTMIAYTPKATVQAAIGGIPLALGLSCGNTVLTVAVLAIVLTAPLGAFAIDISYQKLLSKQ